METELRDTHYGQLDKQYENKPAGYYGLDRVEMLPFIPAAAKKILDIGCGEGGFGKMLKEKDPSLIFWGLEPSPSAAGIAGRVLDKVINNVFNEGLPELENEKFGAIVFNDVLEHLASPDNSIRLCSRYLDEKGCIVASIPNILFYPVVREIVRTQDWQYTEHGTLDNTHLRFFTRKSIIRLFEENGYRILKIEGINARSCGRLYRILNTIFYKKLKDWKFLQFAVQAQKIS